MASLWPMAEVAKIPHPKDMDEGWEGQFLQHWVKRHSYEGYFDKTHEVFKDDSAPLWSAIKSLHNRIHEGKADIEVPTDHLHLIPLAEQIKKDLEDLI